MSENTTRRNRRSNREAINTETEANAEVEGAEQSEEGTEEPTEEVTETTEETPAETTVETTEPSELVSVYQAARVVNGWLKDRGAKTPEGAAKVLPPQMFYNYTTARINKGNKPAIEVETVDGKHFIRRTTLATWFEGYFAKNVTGKLLAAEAQKAEAAEVVEVEA